MVDCLELVDVPEYQSTSEHTGRCVLRWLGLKGLGLKNLRSMATLISINAVTIVHSTLSRVIVA